MAITRTPEEVAQYPRNFIETRGADWDWDDFESVPIADPALERIRRQAALAAPPNPNMKKLADLLKEAEALILPKG
jgi:hypothetical protein